MSEAYADGERLLKCSSKPNCVCSEYQDDAAHFITPIDIPSNNHRDLMALLQATIREMGGEIQTTTSTHISAIFTSTVFGFVDDLELRFDPVGKQIHLRSASRIGYSDFGVNKRRIEQLKNLYREKLGQ